eukprot:1800266-Heterocapsa_arctica.AAC.1
MDAALEPQEQAERAKWICKASEAKEQCLTELQNVQKTRKQMNVAKDRLPRWAEASVGVMEHIMKENDYGSISVLSLSNILRSGRPSA